MKAQHTPGPWHVGIGQHDGETPFITVFSGDKIVAVAGIVNDDHHSQSMVDANVIAAVPELLEALEDVTDRLDWLNSDDNARIMEATDKARSAIAKAKGER